MNPSSLHATHAAAAAEVLSSLSTPNAKSFVRGCGAHAAPERLTWLPSMVIFSSRSMRARPSTEYGSSCGRERREANSIDTDARGREVP